MVLVHGWGSRAGRFSVDGGRAGRGGLSGRGVRRSGARRSTGRFASLPEFARALRAVSDEVGPVHGVVGHSLGGAAVTLALRDGLAAERVVLLAAPADVVRFSTAFADHLRLTPVTRAAMRRNLETRLRMRWDELHLPTIARSLRTAALVVHDRDDADVPYGQADEIARGLAGRAARGHRRARPPGAAAGRRRSSGRWSRFCGRARPR